MTDFCRAELGEYLQRLASADVVPGGGGAAALTGAQAAALLSMVCNLTGAGRFPDQAKEVRHLHALAEQSRQRLTGLVTEDGEVFSRLMTSYRLPGKPVEAAEKRKSTLQASLREAAAVPLDIMTNSGELLPIAGRLVEIGNPRLLSDVGVALHLIRAAICSAEVNVRINCRSIQDAVFNSQCDRTICNLQERLERESAPLLEKIREAITG